MYLKETFFIFLCSLRGGNDTIAAKSIKCEGDMVKLELYNYEVMKLYEIMRRYKRLCEVVKL